MRNSPQPSIKAMSADTRALVAANILNALLVRWKFHVPPPAAIDLYLDLLGRLDVAAETDEADLPAPIDWG